jgi:dienelactone hydrolase
MKTLQLVALLLLALALAGCGDGSGTSSPVNEPDGTFAVGEAGFVFVDSTRPTAANGSEPAKDSRTLRTTVYYPAAGAPGGPAQIGAPPASGRRFPLIVFAHGFTAIGKIYFTTLQAWAAAGYVVAAPDFPLSSGSAPGGPSAGDYINQPADESFVIDQLLELNGDTASVLHDLIDAEHVGASGQSLGGMTTFGLAFNTCCRDPRIDAAAPMAGRLAPFPAGEYRAEIGPPLLIIHGDADDTVDYASAIEAYDLLLPPKLLLTHEGGGHILPYVGSNAALAATIEASTAFFDLFLKRERGARERLLAAGARERVALEYELESQP